MKHLLTITLFFLSLSSFAQKPCDYSVNVTDSIGKYKSTKEYMICEKNFGGTASYIFFSLALTDNLPTLNVQLIQKSKDFLKANCFDKNSKLFLQLNNGKIVTLIHIDEENCGAMIRDDKNYDNRVITASFMFMKDSFEELKSSPISMMRIKYLTDTEDYVIKKEFTSELDNVVYQPENYFINTIRCVE
ncbi:hypothetical protein H4V97_000695 [Flavobacterium sp. CG_23.5]|uniref:hypothetical protein n=1 Tax=Flavobacterium sp. CG_23.5 TaxID=2760708 RepID=UPI001AE7EA52|nr:hypothetical protein [Flavobacterium sp. CG_23.5]MBP2282377.1 hypothetical protein [Flavobacterium sp. CG_23.5]